MPQLARTLGTNVSYLISGESDGTAVDDHAAAVIRRARREIADALSFDISRVRIEIDTLA